MGIPFYFKNIINRHSDIIIKNAPSCHRLFLDYNCVLHQSANAVITKHPHVDIQVIEGMIIEDSLQYIETIVNATTPTQLLFIAVDGMCPRAKMVQQRKRRFVNAWRNGLLYDMRSKLGQNTSWDSNAITPGTQFMAKFNACIAQYVKNKKQVVPYNIILSDSTEFGEGEHKIFDYIKSHDQCTDVIYGLDADLLMLSMVSNNTITLLREAQIIDKQKSASPFLTVSISALKNGIISEYFHDHTDHIQCINDYVMVCVLMGNDFIPPLSFLKIKENGIDYVMNAYNNIAKETGEYFVMQKDNKLNMPFLQKLLLHMAKNEDQSMIEACDMFHNKVYTPDKRYGKPNPLVQLQHELDNYPISRKLDNAITNAFNPRVNGWRMQYYHVLMGAFTPEVINDACQSYIMGVEWIYRYYFAGTSEIQLNWYYKYAYSPTLLDMSTHMHQQNTKEDNDISNDLFKKMVSDDNNSFQLLMVLPPHSRSLLPDYLKPLVINIATGCVHYYPHSFKLATFLKYYLWECTPLLPDIDIKHLYGQYCRAINQN